MSFKDIVKKDVYSTFLNLNEFADYHILNGKRLRAVVDDTGSEGEIAVKFHGQTTKQTTTLYNTDSTVYVSASEFPKPKIGSLITLDNRRFLAVAVTEYGGILEIKLQIAGGR